MACKIGSGSTYQHRDYGDIQNVVYILKLLIYDILNISVISVLIGTAASYFTGQIWLEQFSERIDMDLLLFIGIALLVLLVIVACVVVKAWHVANENPVKSIKAE